MNNMDRIKINCDECEFVNNLDGMLIDFNYDYVKNIIDSNYITCIHFCNHKANELINIATDVQYLPSGFRYANIVNRNYIETYNRFVVKEDNETLKILLNNHKFEPMKEINFEEFKNLIKRGSIILFYSLKLIQKLEKILLEHNLHFILKKLVYTTFIVDTPNYTKPAL